MSDYQFLIGVSDEITSELTLSNVVHNQCDTVPSSIEYKVGVYTQDSLSTEWVKVDERIFGGSTFLSFYSKDYNLNDGEIAVVVPVPIGTNLNQHTNTLPLPISRKLDRSHVNERGMIRFVRDGNQSSYQGEYPHQMSSRTKGSMISFGTLLSGQPNFTHTKIVLINICSSPLSKKEKFKCHLSSVSTTKTLQVHDYTHNSCAIFEVDHSLISEELVLSSHSTNGIPIFISYNPGIKGSMISVEHSHPPSEYFFGNPDVGLRVFKKTWLPKLKKTPDENFHKKNN
jgi:hypothetical protein